MEVSRSVLGLTIRNALYPGVRHRTRDDNHPVVTHILSVCARDPGQDKEINSKLLCVRRAL